MRFEQSRMWVVGGRLPTRRLGRLAHTDHDRRRFRRRDLAPIDLRLFARWRFEPPYRDRERGLPLRP
jgi:hypothetical protein